VRAVANRHGLPKIYRRDGGTLTGPSQRLPEEIAKDFLTANRSLFALEATDSDRLRLAVRDVTPSATFLSFNQTVDGIDVYNGHVKFTLGKRGEVVQAGAGDVIPGLRLTTVPRLSAEEAVRIAMQSAGATVPTALPPAAGRGSGVAFANPQGRDFSPITAELSVFPMDAETARLAYRIFVEAGELAWYEVLIDAENGSLLFRQNLYSFAGQARVWTQSPTAPAERETVTLPDEWLAPGTQVTLGNNADAYLDTNADNRADTLTNEAIKDGRAFSESQSFDFPFADGLSGEDPRKYQAAAVTNLFYLINKAHDYYYSLGFTEAAGNFQTDNFGRGGRDKDPVIGQAQYGGFTNNASFATPSDGLSPRMRMGIFTRSTTTRTDDLDSAVDGHVVLHEYGHGVSNRLVGGGTGTSCLSGRIQGGAMGEGWSDYFAISYYDNPAFGMYTAQNSIQGIRRQNYEGYTFTYEDVGNLSIGSQSLGYEVHADGEIWAATLWDLRKALGKEVTDRLVVAGLKATPCRPSMIDARDAILTADQATNDGANRAAIWQVFSRHGMGYSAKGTDGTRATGTTYDAAYDIPPDWGGAPNPAITSAPLTVTGSMGVDYSYEIKATNPNEGALAFDLVSGPKGMLVDRSTGAVRWMPGFVGQRVKIAVADGRGGKVIHGYHLPVSTLIPTGAPTTIGGDVRTTGYATFDVPEGMQILQVTLRNGQGDPDLFVFDPINALQSSTRSSVNETLTFESPRAGRWRVEVDGLTRYADVTLKAEVGFPALLTAGDSVEGLSGVEGSELLFRIPVPVGATSFEVSTSGGIGDVDIYLRKGRPALCQLTGVSTACRYDKSSLEDGNGESIVIENPEAADWYLVVSGYRGFSGVTLKTTAAVPATLEGVAASPSAVKRP
jgi:Zn-dependent metalloprotease